MTNQLDFMLLHDESISVSLALLDIGLGCGIYKEVEFVVDTGASKTLISLVTFLGLGYKHLKADTYQTVGTFAGDLNCYNYKIPSFRLAGTLMVEKPTIWVPDDPKCVCNVLGQNILKEYNYFVDNDVCCIYFEPKSKSNLSLSR